MIVTLAAAQAFLGITADPTDAEVIITLITAAQAAMEARAGRHFGTIAVTETLDGPGAYTLYLREPAETLTSFTVAGIAGTVADVLVEGAALTKKRGKGVWVSGRRNVVVVYAAGFVTVPDDLAHACLVQVGKLYSERGLIQTGANVLSAQKIETWSQTFMAHNGLDPLVEAVVKRYACERL